MSKQDIEKRLGFAAQGVKETTSPSVKVNFAENIRVIATEANNFDKEIGRLYDRIRVLIQKSDRVISMVNDNETDPVKARAALTALKSEANALVSRSSFSRPGAKAKFGIWGDAPDKYRAAIDFIQNQRTPSSAAISDLKKAIKNRQSEAVKTRDPKSKRMYEDDAGGLQNVLEHAQRGDHATLLRSAYNLDTAVRDDIPIEMFIWAGADVNWSHRNAKSLLDTVSALVNRTKHGKSVGIKAARPGVKAKA